MPESINFYGGTSLMSRTNSLPHLIVEGDQAHLSGYGPLSVASTAPIALEPTKGVSFIHPHLCELAPYTPFKPFEILSARLGRSPQDIVKLDANENPYGPRPKVMEDLEKREFSNIYLDLECRRLGAALAAESRLGAEHILVGCSADKLIDIIVRCTLDPGDTILDFPPTFTMYAFDAAVTGANVVKGIPLKRSLLH